MANVVRGPPHRKVNKSPEKLTDEILACKTPTYFNVGRAWNILGYYRSPRPTLNDFVVDIEDLWTRQGQDHSLKGRRARASILDALRTLGFRNANWKANTRHLHADVRHQDGSWLTLPDPPRGGNNYGKSDAREYLAATAPPATNFESSHQRHANALTWSDYHRYQGFKVDHAVLGNVFMRAIPVPPGADSLWHSVSYVPDMLVWSNEPTLTLHPGTGFTNAGRIP
jgi:hypothetical protein